MPITTAPANISDSNRFLAFFLLGAVMMLLSKLVLNVTQLYVTLPPVLIMALYFALLARGHHATNRPERAGDNIYYLGFLFTLVSLGLALYEFGESANEKDSLIADFAIALSTTILGVLGRVWLTQGDKEVDEYEKEAKLHVADAIDELRNDLERSRETIIDFATVTRQILEENRDEQRKQLGQDRVEFERHFTAALQTMSEGLTKAVSDGSKRLVDEAERLTASIADQSEIFISSIATLNKGSDELASSLSSAVKVLQSMPDLEVILQEKVALIVTPLDEATKRIVNILDQQKIWAEQSATSVSSVVGTLATLGKAINEVGEASNVSLSKIKMPADLIVSRMTYLQSAFDQIVKQVDGLKDFVSGLDRVPQQLARSVESIDALGSAFVKSTDKVSSTLNAFNFDLEQARNDQLEATAADTGRLRELSENRDHLFVTLSATSHQLGEQLMQLQKQFGVMTEALVGAAQFIRKEAGKIT